MTAPKRPEDSLPPSYFEAKYAADIDPWRFRTSPYERDKYQATIAALSRGRYRRGLEVGCAIGVLSSLLAARSDALLALDGSATAIAEAKRQDLPNVVFEIAFLPDEFPDGRFDLIVLSEVLYYFAPVDLARLAEKCLAALDAGGEMILCHWLGETDYPLTGRQASEIFGNAVTKLRPSRQVLHDDVYLLERFCFPRADGGE
jgi:SAM-dependent methyltransferase